MGPLRLESSSDKDLLAQQLQAWSLRAALDSPAERLVVTVVRTTTDAVHTAAISVCADGQKCTVEGH